MSLSDVDRELLQRCLDRAPHAWQDFVDRFLGLVVHVVNHTAQTRQVSIDASTRDDLVAEVFLELVQNDFATLRRFRRGCSLATYLTVIARRVIVRRMMQMRSGSKSHTENGYAEGPEFRHAAVAGGDIADRIADVEQVQNLLGRLDPREAEIVRLFHLEGKSYGEISDAVGMSENSIGPVLSRAKAKLRNGKQEPG